MSARPPVGLDLTAILDLYEAGTPETDRAWRELVVAAAGLGAALGRFQSALDAYGETKRSADAGPPPEAPTARVLAERADRRTT